MSSCWISLPPAVRCDCAECPDPEWKHGDENGIRLVNRGRDRDCMKTQHKRIKWNLATTAAICTAGFLAGSAWGQAGVLTHVPMQGGMLMPEVSYHAEGDRVTVDLSNIGLMAQLTPLLISHPNDTFDPDDPWFECLDPSRQGLAFSRRYGFEMHPNTDLLPADRELWIRKTAGSADLGIYDYNASTLPKRWIPIFGTAGSSTTAFWSGLMWHVGVTAPPGTNTYSATFEVYVVNTATGQEVPESSSAPFLLEWTCVPDDRPGLDIAVQAADDLVLTWPTSATNWSLVCSTNLLDGPWTPVEETEAAAIIGPAKVRIQGAAARQFYRLRRNP